MFKIRFNLGSGANFMKWRIENTITKEVAFHSPDKVMLIMENAQLRNQRGTAQKIHQGKHKEVCGWIDAETVTILKQPKTTPDLLTMKPVQYNPRISPFWRNENEENIDGKKYDVLVTNASKVYSV